MTASNIIFGIIFLAVGFVFIWKQKKIVDIVGRIDFAERKLGGTYNMMVLIGVLCIVMGFVFLAGCIEPQAPGSDLDDVQIEY